MLEYADRLNFTQKSYPKREHARTTKPFGFLFSLYLPLTVLDLPLFGINLVHSGHALLCSRSYFKIYILAHIIIIIISPFQIFVPKIIIIIITSAILIYYLNVFVQKLYALLLCLIMIYGKYMHLNERRVFLTMVYRSLSSFIQ